MQSHGIHISFDDEQALEVGTRPPGFIQRIQLTALVKEGGLGGVEILRLPLLDDAPPEGDDPSARIADREHDPVPEAVIVALAIANLPSLPLNDEPQVRELPAVRLVGAEAPEHLVPGVRCEADPKVLDDFPFQSTALEVLPRPLIARQSLGI